MSTLTRRALLGSTLLAGLAACSPASNGGASSATPTASELVFGLTFVPNIQFAPVYVAQAKGWFADEGLKLTLRHHGAQEKLLGALQSGDEHVVFAGGGEMLQGRSEGIKVTDFATVYQTYPVTIIVPADSPIKTLADLRGHSIGLPGEFGENWFYLLAVLAETGLSRDDVKIVSIGYTQFAAITGGQIDAVIGYRNNEVVRCQEAGFEIRTLELATPPLVSVGLGALEEVVATKNTELTGLLRALAKGAEFCVSDPDEAVQIATDYVPNLAEADQRQYALAVLKATTKLYGEDFGAQDEARWQAMTTFFADHDLLAAPVAANEIFTASIVAG